MARFFVYGLVVRIQGADGRLGGQLVGGLAVSSRSVAARRALFK